MAEMDTAAINDLPDSAFAYIEPGGTVVDGKTEPRSLRHFPIHDAAHVRNALARAMQSPFGPKAMPAIRAAAKKFGIEMGQKAVTEIKAEPLTTKALEAWLSGERSRRIMVVPFGGPLPGGKAGLDLDGEYFDADTDLVGPFPALQRSRERLVDWHHDDDEGVPHSVPTMKGTILGRIILDEGPSTLKADDADYEGVAADFWAKAGERRLALIKALQARGAALYGSSQAVKGGIRIADDGHIELWPLIRHTMSTSPQNTYAVVPPLKAVLAADLPFDEVGVAALKAALASIDDLGPDLRATFRESGGKRAAKARRVEELAEEATHLIARLRARATQPIEQESSQ
jgi:hypothetical protein